MFLLLFALTHKVRVESDARIIHENATIDLPDIHPGDLTGEEIIDRGGEVKRNAGVLGEMVQGAHRQNAERRIGAYELASHGIDRSVTASSHDRATVLAQRTRSQSRDIVAAFCDHDLHVGAKLTRNTRNVRLRLVDVHGMAVEDAGGV